MSKTNKKDNVRNVNKWRGYYLEDCACVYCEHFISKKRGCKLPECCCEEEKRDAEEHNRIKRKRGSMKWDM